MKIFVLQNEILVVNILGVENYLSSVVGSEMPTKHMEALKAQAIASRTYALKQKEMLYMTLIRQVKIRFIEDLRQKLLKLQEL